MLLEGSTQPIGAMPLVTRALERCPGEPRLLLAYAVLTDQLWTIDVTTPRPRPRTMLSPAVRPATDVLARYDEAMKFEETEAEARAREAWCLYRTGKFDDALRVLDGLKKPASAREPRYWTHLIRGHVLRALGQFEPAAAAYRAAMDDEPGAQSARVALMTLLATHGDRLEAESLAEAIQTAPDDSSDPWWWFWQGDYYLYSGLIARLREVAR